MSLETFQISKMDIKEENQRLKDDIKNSLNWLKNNITNFLQEKDDQNFEVNTQNIKDFLESKKNSSRKELIQNRDVAAVTKAILLTLKSKGIYKGKIDWYLWNPETKKAIEDFQEKVWLNKDWAPWPKTIEKVLELLENQEISEEEIKDNKENIEIKNNNIKQRLEEAIKQLDFNWIGINETTSKNYFITKVLSIINTLGKTLNISQEHISWLIKILKKEEIIWDWRSWAAYQNNIDYWDPKVWAKWFYWQQKRIDQNKKVEGIIEKYINSIT